MNDSVTPAVSDTHVTPTEGSRSGSRITTITNTLSRFHFIPRLIGYARVSYLVGLVLALLIVSPVDWLPTPLLKITVYALILMVTTVLFVLGGGIRELWRAPGRTLAIAASLALPAAYLLSWWTSSDRSVALTGVGNEIDTLLFVCVAALTLIFGFGLLRTMRSITQLIAAIGLAVIIAAVFQYVSILMGSWILPAVFADKSVNLVGKWNDFGMLISIGFLFLLARLELGEDEGWRRWAAIAALVLLAVLIMLVQFNFIWWFTAAGAVVIGLLKWLPQVHMAEPASPVAPSRIPKFAGAAIVVCAVFLMFGTAIVSSLPGFLSVPSLEVRPAMSTTLGIGAAAHKETAVRPFLGTGPNTFVNDWLVHKPLSVNETPFWSVDFITGFSVLSTAFVTTGVAGALAWLIPVLLLVMALWQLRTIRNMQVHERLTLLSLGLASAFLWVGIMFYAGSQNMVLLAFATVGAIWATEAAARRKVEIVAAPPRQLASIGSAAAAFVLVIVVVWPAYASARQLLSYAYHQQAGKALGSGDIFKSAELADASQRTKLTGDNLRLGIAINFARMRELAAASTSPTTIDAMRTQFQAALQGAIVQGQTAALIHPKDYQAYAALGQVYEFLVPLRVPGAYESAQAAYRKAMEINPTNPTLPLLLARLEATQDLKTNEKAVIELLNKSLALKPNYTDAFLFAEQVAVAQNDLAGATRAAEAAVASNPQNPALWFQLGLFYYTGENWSNAFKSFQNAVGLQGDYANAKYFLGLSAHKLGDNPAAIVQFRDLTVSNPDNAEVKLILGNLEAGREPFAGQTPPQPPPEDRQTAPVEEATPDVQ